MYAIDGIPLKNTTYGWRLKRDSTNPFAPLARSLVDFNTSGRDGTIQVRGYTQTPTITLNVTTPLANLDDLKQLFLLGSSLTLVGDSIARAQKVELVTLVVTPWAVAGIGIYLVSAVLRCPEVYWRDTSTADYGPTTFTSGQTITAFTGSTAPIRDALVSIKGTVTNPSIAGQNGTYLTYTGTLNSTTYLTFDTATGRAWTGASAFALTTEVTTLVSNGRGPYFLEMTGSSDPAVTTLSLVVTGSALTSPTITIRGRKAYNL